jgi:carbamoyl-phosphate synthase small subunit
VGAYLLLEDGACFYGDAVGAVREVTGEVVFNTSMSGYQEAVTDPSYRGQIIVFTYPMIGNYGVSTQANESQSVHARAVVMREGGDTEHAPDSEVGWLTWLYDCDVPAISGIDTRAVVRHIRDKGAMRGGIFDASVPIAVASQRVLQEPPMDGRDLVGEVTQSQVLTDTANAKPLVCALDTGIKNSILSNLRSRVQLELHPASTSAQSLLARQPRAVFLANGPGDPAALDYIVSSVGELLGRVPVFGICLGHQLVCRALGLETFKLTYGHRGANHPVKDLFTGRIHITSQNHGFSVVGPSGERALTTDEPVRWQTAFGVAELSQLNLYDRTVEGLFVKDISASTVQYHPEAGPGPHDASFVFERFFELIGA